jgi:cold shock protein
MLGKTGKTGDSAAISLVFAQNPAFVCATQFAARQVSYGTRTCRFAGTGSSPFIFSRGDDVMAKGTVKWFNPTKGYGFIQPSSGGKDIFVHISAVQKAGLSTLNEGQMVEYEEVANRGKTSAENLKV